MSKKKRTSQPKRKKDLSKTQMFFLGIVIGAGLFWLPLDSEFSPIQFHKKPWEHSDSVFAQSLPTTTPLLRKEGFILAYNGQTRNPQWVYHKLTAVTSEKTTSREDCEFKPEPLIPAHLRASLKDYSGSGFDRGHLCPAADCNTQKAMQESFFLSNIAPQTPAFNRGYWKKLEGHVRGLTKNHHAVHVFSGPLYLSSKGRDGKRYVKYQVIGKSDVAVPTHFFLLVFAEQTNEKMLATGYILPNKSIDANTPLKKFATSVEEIEKASGTLFTHIL